MAEASEANEAMVVDLSGKVALVTGASQGLGQAMAVRLGKANAKVACVARNAEKLAGVVEQITESGGEAAAFPCDVTDSESVKKVVEEVTERWERLDILVNNAGITRDTLIPRMGDDEWDMVLNTNLRGAFLFTRAATMPMMQQRFGRIINISSVSGAVIGNPGQANYSASKAGLVGLTKTVARELGKRKITVNAICPGIIESEMTQAVGDDYIKEFKKRIPANRLGQAKEVAELVLFLSSDAAAYINGTAIAVDGGMTC
ncbi:MAG: 3-oxoacyl-[acyl-carrier-protein] reductase [Pirellulales bacterium]|nr:3-oxoacyl-[acyl-carrier-protein] reductase [Pirellulales bacterium]